MPAAKDEESLLSRIGKATPFEGRCTITVANGTPADWGVTIEQAGCKFFYDGGTDYQDGPVNVGLSSGNSYQFESNDPGKCVQQVFVAMMVAAPGENPQTFTWRDGVDAQHCMISDGVTLAPKNSVAHGMGKSGKIDLKDFLEVRRNT